MARSYTDDDWQARCEDLEEDLNEARAVARRCWEEWRRAAGPGYPPGEVLAIEHPWLRVETWPKQE